MSYSHHECLQQYHEQHYVLCVLVLLTFCMHTHCNGTGCLSGLPFRCHF